MIPSRIKMEIFAKRCYMTKLEGLIKVIKISRNAEINSLVEWFSERLMKLHDNHCPKKTKTVSYKKVPSHG